MSPTLCSEVQNLMTQKIWTLCPQKPKNVNLTNSSLVHYPWPIQIHKDLKDLSLKFISWLWNCCTFSFGDAASGWFFSVAAFRSLFATFNSATFSNHLKMELLSGNALRYDTSASVWCCSKTQELSLDGGVGRVQCRQKLVCPSCTVHVHVLFRNTCGNVMCSGVNGSECFFKVSLARNEVTADLLFLPVSSLLASKIKWVAKQHR